MEGPPIDINFSCTYYILISSFSCTEITHHIITSKSIPAPFIEDFNELITIAYLYYESNNIILLEEYLIFDFWGILVAIGGSIGLFLRFSFRQGRTVLFTYSIDVKLCHEETGN